MRCSLGAAALLVAVLGCDGRATRITGEVDWDPPPDASTPADAVRLLVWSWRHEDTTRYARVLPANFTFAFAPWDTFGTLFPGRVLDRGLEMAAVRSLFFTGVDSLVVAPRSVAFVHEADLVDVPDPRPGRDPSIHRMISAPATLRLYEPDFEAAAAFRMFLVRGDAAAWPSGLPHGPGSDSNFWFVERWEDMPIAAGATTISLPSNPPTLGRIKALYLGYELPR